MATKPKAGGSKKRKSDPPDKEVQKTQHERFVKTALALEADQSGKLFEEAFKNLLNKSGRERPD